MNSFTVNKFIRNNNLNRYIRVKTYNTEESNIITQMLRQPDKGTIGDLYFDDTGSIRIRNRGDDKDIVYLNPLTKKEPAFDSGSIIEPNDTIDYKLFFSLNNGLWFLYVDDNNALKPVVSLFYNPVGHPEFARYYIESSNKEQVNNYVIDACLENQIADPVCICLNRNQLTNSDPDTEFCMNDLFNGDVVLRKSVKNDSKSRQGYDQLAKVCKCSNVKCKNETHPLMVVQDKCPTSLTVTMCNTSFNAGEGANQTIGGMGGVNIAQSCGATNTSGGSSPPPPPPPPPPPAVGPVTPPTDGKPVIPLQSGDSQFNYILIFGGGFSLLIIMLIIFVLFRGK